MATPSNVYMNWKSVTVSYGVGPTVLTITEVLDVQVVDTENIEMWQADGTIFPTLAIRASAMRGLQIIGFCHASTSCSWIPEGRPAS